MKNPVRLAALMELPSIFVYTHDSIGLGEDGPTHQPIEHLAALRAIPGLYAVRPADANETALGWEFALAQSEHPTAPSRSRARACRCSTRTSCPTTPSSAAPTCSTTPRMAEPEVILIGTGSEVGLCASARELLEADGIPTRVVSMPCSSASSSRTRRTGTRCCRPACERARGGRGGRPLGWDRFVGDQGAIIGMTTLWRLGTR